MEFYILDTEFNPIMIVERAESMIWTDRYCGYGDFEIYAPVDTELFSNAQIGNYVWFRGSDRLMIIDTVSISTAFESGTHLKISGKSLEYLLARRIIWHQTTFESKFDYAIHRALRENAIEPSDADRLLPHLKWVDPDTDELSQIQVTCQETGTNLYDFIVSMCEEVGCGFRVTYDDTDDSFAFQLYVSTDRSYEQDKNPYVVFSNEFENLFNSNYYDSVESYCNVALVAGEVVEGQSGQITTVTRTGDDESGQTITIETVNSSETGKTRRTTTVGDASGMDRRELYVDARDIQSENEDGTDIDLATYANLLYTRGEEKLSDVSEETYFEGEVEPSMTFVYGVDYFLGDIVQLRNEFGVEAQARITEIVWSHDESGETMIPTFELV